MSESSRGRHLDEESTPIHTAVKCRTNPYDANSVSRQNKSRPVSIPNVNAELERNDDRRVPRQEPPWRCDRRIYESRFVQSCFWGSQIGILSLGALFVVFYCQLFFPIGIPAHSKLQSTLATDFGIWFIVGCTILGWSGMAVLLLIIGAIFSSLFKVDNQLSGEVL